MIEMRAAGRPMSPLMLTEIESYSRQLLPLSPEDVRSLLLIDSKYRSIVGKPGYKPKQFVSAKNPADIRAMLGLTRKAQKNNG